MSKSIYILQASKIYGARESRAQSTGGLNTLLAKKAEEILSPHHRVLLNNIADGYDYMEERERILSHDLVIFQFPIFWFNMPHFLKAYMDDIYTSPQFWHNEAKSLAYGRGGHASGKYMLSVTFNAPKAAFSAGGFTGGASPDDVLRNVHLTQQYIGLQPLPTFAAYNVYRVYDEACTTLDPLADYESHLRRFVLNED